MNNIHPDWQETEGDAVNVRAKISNSVMQNPASRSVTISRKPAAIVGMLLVLGFGIVFFHGVDGLITGQVSNQGNRKTIMITAQGFSPQTIEVEHGETLVWVNEDTASHAVVSSSLCSNTGFCLQTAPLAKGGQGTFTITPDIPSGSYSYGSSANASMKGSIEIITTAAQNFENIPSPSESNSDGISTNPNTSLPLGGAPGTFFDPAVNPFSFDRNEVPSNPFATGGNNNEPFDAEAKAISANFEPAPTQAQAMLMHTKPDSQPSTGTGSWLAVLTSLCVVLYVIRGKMQAFTELKD